MSGTVELNGKELFKGKIGFCSQSFQKLIKRKLGPHSVTSVRMDRLECEEETMNELFELTNEAISDETEDGGLQQLRLSEFHAKIEIDASVLERMAQKTKNL